MATYEHCYVCNWVLLLLHSQIQPDRRTVLCQSYCSASGVGTAVTSHTLPCPHMEGRAACCLLCCTLVFGFLGWVMLITKPSQAECVLLLGKNNQKKARGDSSSSLCWVAYKVSRVYWLLGCFCICFKLQLADMGRLDCWSLIPEVPVSVQWVSLSCPFVEEQESGLTVEHSDARVHSMAGFVWCLGQGYQWQNSTSAGQQGPACCSSCLCRALESWACCWPCHTLSSRRWGDSSC